jgi:type IV pilus assembly protein PilE
MSQNKLTRGVTLIELMVVIVVLTIIVGIAVPSYRNYLLRANRTEARTALLRIQSAQEKFFLQKNRYATNALLDDAPPAGLGIPTATPSGFYSLSISDYSLDPPTYTATATATGGQTKDVAACRIMSIDQDGVRLPAESSGCWR